jgi:hypothetical protein
MSTFSKAVTTTTWQNWLYRLTLTPTPRGNEALHRVDTLIDALDHDAVLAQNDGRFAEADSPALQAARKPGEIYALTTATWTGPYLELFVLYRRASWNQWPDTAETVAR